MYKHPKPPPKYRLHKPSGLAVVTLSGKDHYLGDHGSPESRAAYDRLIGEWLTRGRKPETVVEPERSDLTVNEIVLRYLAHADNYYRNASGEPTGEADTVRLSVRPLVRLFGHMVANQFGPRTLKAVREVMVQSDLCRNEVNRRVQHIRRVFRWAASEELISAEVDHRLQTVRGIPKGRYEARESVPVKPIHDSFVDGTLPYLSPTVRTMVELQRLTGMRPGEVCRLRMCELERTGKVWVFTPSEHKTSYLGKARRIYIGPRGQALLQPWLKANANAYLFRPDETMDERRAELRRNRKSPMTPSQSARTRKRNPKRTPGDQYDVHAYRRAIARGVAKANRALKRAHKGKPGELQLIPKWGPNRLRHNAATKLRREFGIETARAALGHSTLNTTEIYAEQDEARILDVMQQVG